MFWYILQNKENGKLLTHFQIFLQIYGYENSKIFAIKPLIVKSNWHHNSTPISSLAQVGASPSQLVPPCHTSDWRFPALLKVFASSQCGQAPTFDLAQIDDRKSSYFHNFHFIKWGADITVDMCPQGASPHYLKLLHLDNAGKHQPSIFLQIYGG